MTTVLILGASGRVGSNVVRDLDANPGDLTIRLASHLQSDADQWQGEGRDGIAFDLNDPTTFAAALEGVERVFLLTTYTGEMLFQGKTFVDAAVDAGVRHIVHLGVFSSRRDLVPHYTWHDLLESYIAASGIAWTNIHPNNIVDSILITEPSLFETRSFTVDFGDAAQGFVGASDIGAVAAAVLREGPEKHAGKDYWLSPELLTGTELAQVLTDALGVEITADHRGHEGLAQIAGQVPHAGMKLYLESAVQKMKLAAEGNLPGEQQVRDDVQTVLGRPALPIAQWAKKHLRP